MTRLDQKVKSYFDNTIKALWQFYSINDIESAFHSLRNACEAFLKVVIYKHFGENDGYSIIKGKKNFARMPIQDIGYNLSFSQLRDGLMPLNLLDEDVLNVLNSIDRDANKYGSHDSNQQPLDYSVLEAKIKSAIASSEKLSEKLSSLLDLNLSAELKRGYREHSIEESFMNSIKAEDIDEMLLELDNFSQSNRYVLVAPRQTDKLQRNQMRTLHNIPWAFVLDFNPQSKKKGGLYESFMPEIEKNSVPLTIIDKDKPILGNGNAGNINWVFANGIDSMYSTLASDIYDWTHMKYHKFIKKIFQNYCQHSLKRLCVVCLYDDFDYIQEVVRAFEDIDEIEKDLLSFVFVSSDSNFLNKVEGFRRYDFAMSCYNIDISTFLASISEICQEKIGETSIFVPARSNTNNRMEDISDIYTKLLDNGVFPLHQSLGLDNVTIDQIPSFYKGETISWNELAADIDVKRDIYYDLRKNIETKLDTAHSSKRYDLVHKPGAGGTTISRRLAFDLRRNYPVVILMNYKANVTFRNLDVLSRRVARPILAIIDSSVSGNVDDLINECNVSKRIIIFLVISRETKRHGRGKDKSFSSFMQEMMSTPEEKMRFMQKVKLYRENKVNNLEKIPYRNLEVIDFALNIGDEEYETKQIEKYLRSYINGLSEPVSEFLMYVSMIYHYSQKPVNENIFRKLFMFKNHIWGLSVYLAHHKEEQQLLNKIIVQEKDDSDGSCKWRPRFSRFADISMQILLGGEKLYAWKEYLPEYSIKLIQTVKANNEYLCEDVEKMLAAVFLNRGAYDPLGIEETWESNVVNDKFSLLVEDLAIIPDAQKRVLKKLAETFPDKSHFWGHLARFCYEKANTPKEFEEASLYVENALQENGELDPVILHVAGMCKRRIIEYYKRNNLEMSFEELKEMTEVSKAYFEASRKQKALNVHSYISEIQLILIVIEYGKWLSKSNNYLEFLVAETNVWFLDLYEEMDNLIKLTEMLVNQMSTIAINQRLTKSIRYLTQSESSAHEILGDYNSSLATLRKRIELVDRSERPRLRLLYVNTLLRSKVNGNMLKIKDAWTLLDAKEMDVVRRYLDLNITSGSNNAFSLKAWFDYVRYTDDDISLEDVKSRLRILYSDSVESPLLQLEAAFYLYVINAIELISENDYLDARKIEETNEWIAKCNKISPNNKHTYEWLVSLDGLRGIVSYKDKPEISSMIRLKGTIAKIRNQQQGLIELDCGLKAFFVPSYGSFLEQHDETLPVSFAIGFRHDGLVAMEVERLVNNECDSITFSNKADSTNLMENEEAEIVEDLGEDSALGKDLLENTTSREKSSSDIFKLDSEKNISRIKVVGKIDLKEINVFRKK